MNVHEYQSKWLLKQDGIKVPFGYVINDLNEAIGECHKILKLV